MSRHATPIDQSGRQRPLSFEHHKKVAGRDATAKTWHALDSPVGFFQVANMARSIAIASVKILKIEGLRVVPLGNAENRGRSFEIVRKTQHSAKVDFELLDRTKAARLLGCSVRSFTRLRQKDGFPRPILKSRWLRSELVAWAMAQRS
jgi:predicted DNA-binding transcriptional regulator AlpA